MVYFHVGSTTVGSWKGCEKIQLERPPFFSPLVGLWGGCWSLSRLNSGTGRVQPWTSSSQCPVWAYRTLFKGTLAVLWRCPGTSHATSTVSNVCPQPGLEPRTLRFSAPRDWATAAPTDLHISWFWKATCQGEIASDHLSCGTPMHSVHEVGVVFNLISFQTWSRGGTEGWLRAWLKLDCLYPLL